MRHKYNHNFHNFVRIHLTDMLQFIITALLAGLPVHFSHIGIEEGLSNNTIIDLQEDRHGNLWVATRNGLNCYNGYEFTVYNQQSDNASSIFTDAPLRLATDGEGGLWIASYNGLSKFEEKTGSFSNYPFDEESMVSDMAVLDSGRIVICSGNGIRTFDIGRREFTQIGSLNGLYGLNGLCLYRSGNGLYVGCGDGLYYLDSSSAAPERRWSGSPVSSLCGNGNGDIWIGTENNGVYFWSEKTGTGKRLSKEGGQLNSNYIKDITLDSKGLLWIGTFSGLNIYNPEEGTVQSVTYSPDNDKGLTQAYVNRLYCDSQGGMWTGTYYGGLNYYHQLRDKFSVNADLESLNRLSDHIFNSIVEDENHDLWIGTDIGDIIHFDRSTGRQESFYFHDSSPDKIPFTEVKSIYTSDKYVYICAYAGGLLRYNRKTGKKDYYNRSIGNLPSSKIYSLSPSSNGGIWIATIDGIHHFDTATGDVREIRTDSRGNSVPQFCRVLFKDSSDRLWIGAKGGCYVYGDRGGILTDAGVPILPDEISRQHVNCFFESSDRTIYIGTSDGVFALGAGDGTQEITRISVEDGLSNNVIKAFQEDDGGRIWISTYKGLNSYRREDGTIRSYFVTDGLPSNQYLSRSSCRLHDGTILFGSVKGIVQIDPGRVMDNPFTPKAVFDWLETESGRKDVSDGKITLDAGEKDFTLSFAARNFVSGRKITYSYMLEGKDREWRMTDNNEPVYYTDVNPGIHRMLVKCANNDGIWNEEPAELVITVRKLWYQKTWVILIIVCILLFAAAILWRRIWLSNAFTPLTVYSENGKDRYTLDNVKAKLVSQPSREFLENVIRIIEEDITDYDFSTEKIAEKMHISRSCLHNRLKEITGESAISLIYKVRFTRACRLLEEGGHTISEISALSGFRTQAYFAARFKKEFGCTPSEYLNK